MTDSNGRYFISYRRSPGRCNGDQEGALMRDALRDRGINTWRDLDDLNGDPTEEQLRDVLRNSSLAGAVMLVSEEVKTSEMIKNVEVNQILKRYEKNDGFAVYIVAIGMNYDEVTRILDQPRRLQDLSKFNMTKISKNELTREGAIRVANKISMNRLRLLNENNVINRSTPLQVGLFSRSSTVASNLDLCFDFSKYFDGRRTNIESYETIQSALLDVAKHVASTTIDPKILGQGLASLPLGILFGAVFSKFCFDLTWNQKLRGGSSEPWSLSAKNSDIALSSRCVFGELSSKDIVLAVAISADIEAAVKNCIDFISLKPRATMAISLENGSLKAGESLTASDGVTIARRCIDEIRKLKDELGLSEANVHVFVSAPLGLAVMLGHQLNTFSDCYLYEHMPDANPVYEQVFCFQPSSYNYH